MSEFAIVLTTEEIDNIYLALHHATRGNTNQEAVKDFEALQAKLKMYASGSTVRAVDFMKKLESL